MASDNDNNNNNNNSGPDLGPVSGQEAAIPAAPLGTEGLSAQNGGGGGGGGDTTTSTVTGTATQDGPVQVVEKDVQDQTQIADSSVAAPTTSPLPPASADETSPPASSTIESKTIPITSGTPDQPSSTDKSGPLMPQPANPAGVETPELSDSKIEASSDKPTAAAHEPEDEGTCLVITLLLITGARHPFRIDGKYLRKRGVNVPDSDPFAMSVYTLKELILREWRSEWEPRPSSPSAIRLISFGKLLEDKAPLSDSKFNRDAPNVIHMTVKPQELLDEEDAKVAKSSHGRDREANENSPSCRCVIL